MGTVLVGEEQIEFDDELSFKSFVNTNVSHLDFNNKVIYSSQFYFETPDSETFPQNMTGARFIKCNLDNVIVPAGNTVELCSQRKFEAQEDGFDWLLDENNQPVEKI